jgi:hypothetical protein
MSKAEILRTIVSPNGDGTFVELHIGDGSPRDEAQAPPIVLALRVTEYELPLLAHLQRDALNSVIKLLIKVNDDIDVQMRKSGQVYAVLEPRPAKPRT